MQLRVLERVIESNHPEEWALAVIIAIATLGALAVVKRVLARRLAAHARRTATRVDDLIADMLGATYLLLLVPLAIDLAAQVLTLPERADRFLTHFAVVGLLVQAAIWGHRFMTGWVRYALDNKTVPDPARVSTLGLIGFVARVALWALVLLLALDNLGFNITALLAGLGIGGVAVALAAQHILADLFASVSIVLDKPFVIGDFIVVGDQMGNVEHIGIKTTRLRSLSGEQIVFTNTDLLKSRIHNFQRMAERRVQFGFGVVSRTPDSELEAIPGLIRASIEGQPKTRFDRAHLAGYGDASLRFEAVYYVLDADYSVHMDIHQRILLELLRRLRERRIEIDLATRTLLVERETPAGAIPHRTGKSGGAT